MSFPNSLERGLGEGSVFSCSYWVCLSHLGPAAQASPHKSPPYIPATELFAVQGTGLKTSIFLWEINHFKPRLISIMFLQGLNSGN